MVRIPNHSTMDYCMVTLAPFASVLFIPLTYSLLPYTNRAVRVFLYFFIRVFPGGNKSYTECRGLHGFRQ